VEIANKKADIGFYNCRWWLGAESNCRHMDFQSEIA